ncbi:MAG TPA: amidohydrolase family protein [Steroidobacteraceae bacterium]|nr:amidohydrolase family protein [Steroidobacteraceae bacterium]
MTVTACKPMLHCSVSPHFLSRHLLVVVVLLATGNAGADELLIENVTVISAEQTQPLAGRQVLIRDGRIVSVGQQRIAAKAPMRKLDGRGKFLTPGLMDAHVHVSDAAGIPPIGNEPELVALREAYQRQQPRSYLYFGVTQLLDLAQFAAGPQAFESQPQRPDLFRCGAAVTLDGYPTAMIPVPVRYQAFPDYIFEPANAKEHPLPAGAKEAEHTPEALVEKIAQSGARCVKIFIEDGFGASSEWPMPSRETLARVRAATRKHGLLLVAHANALDMQRIAVDADVDVLAHGLWNWGEFDGQQGVPAPIAAQLRKIHQKGIGYEATLRVLPGTADMFREDTLKDPTYAKVVPPSVLAWYATEPGQWFKNVMRGGRGSSADTKIVHDWLAQNEQGMRALKYMYDLGHPLLVGSDTPSAPTYGSQPGYDTYREMRLMAQSGIPLQAIFEAATLDNARQFGLAKDYGTVEPGKIANLLLLTANPLETMRAWTQIDKVILHGTVIERASLAADVKASQ